MASLNPFNGIPIFADLLSDSSSSFSMPFSCESKQTNLFPKYISAMKSEDSSGNKRSTCNSLLVNCINSPFSLFTEHFRQTGLFHNLNKPRIFPNGIKFCLGHVPHHPGAFFFDGGIEIVESFVS